MDNMEEKKLKIKTLSKELQDIGKKLGDKLMNGDRMSRWEMVWMLMVGACYSLAKAASLLTASRNPQAQINAAKDLLGKLITKDVDSADEKPCESWTVGYYLYSAEQRISSALDRLLKTHCDRNDKVSAFELIIDIVNNFPVSKYKKSSYVILRAFAQEEIKNAFEKYKLDKLPSVDEKGNSWPQGKLLRKVWKRVNDIKHSPFEKTNPENPKVRWHDAYVAFRGLLHIFEDCVDYKLKINTRNYEK